MDYGCAEHREFGGSAKYLPGRTPTTCGWIDRADNLAAGNYGDANGEASSTGADTT